MHLQNLPSPPRLQPDWFPSESFNAEIQANLFWSRKLIQKMLLSSVIECVGAYCMLHLSFRHDPCHGTVCCAVPPPEAADSHLSIFTALLVTHGTIDINWAFSVLLCLCFAYGCLNGLNHFVAGLQWIIFCKYMANILHACLHTLRHEAKHPVGTQK